MKSRMIIGLGITLIALAALWRFGLSSRWTQRIPPGWTWQAQFIGYTSNADAAGQYPAEDPPAFYTRVIRIVDEAERPASITFEDIYTVRDPLTNQVTWEYTYRATVDPRTGLHTTPIYAGQSFVFPRNVAKQTYTLRNSYLRGIPVHYEAEDSLEGLMTYVFAYEGRAEYTDSYEGSPEYPGVPVEAGQEIRCSDDGFKLRLWVEPVTGEIVKVSESCATGDAIYEIATGRLVTQISRWAAETAGDDVILRAARIRAERRRLLWLGEYVPALLLVAGFVASGMGAIRLKRSERGDPDNVPAA